VLEACNGSSPRCPDDGYAAAGTICHPGTAPCESTEVCSGDRVECPAPASGSVPMCTNNVWYTGNRTLSVNRAGTPVGASETRSDARSDNRSNQVELQMQSPFGNPYALDSFATAELGPDTTVSSQLSGTASLGALRARVVTGGDTTDLSQVDPSNTSGRGEARVGWSDVVTVVGTAGQPAGTPVRFTLQLQLDSDLVNSGGEVPPFGELPAIAEATTAATSDHCRFDAATASCSCAGGDLETVTLSLRDLVRVPLSGRVISRPVCARVGDTLVMNGSLRLLALARLKLQPHVLVSADAGHTAKVRLIPESPGVTYVTASGRGPYVADSVPPVVEFRAPGQGATVRGVVQVVVEAGDDSTGVARIEAWAGDRSLGSCTGSPCTLYLDTSAFPDGALLLAAVAHDFEGNASTPAQRQIQVDNTPPIFSNVPGTVTAYATSTAGAKVTYPKPTATDAVDGARPVTCTPASGAQFPVNKTTVTCSASDLRGNQSTATFTVWVTYQAPTDGTFFLRPLRPDDSAFFRIGRPVPVRFKLAGASAGITNLVARLAVTKISSAVSGTVEEVSDETDDDTDFIFKYRPLLKFYAYRWKTRDQTQGTYRLRADLGDGVLHQVNVSLKAPR